MFLYSNSAAHFLITTTSHFVIMCSILLFKAYDKDPNNIYIGEAVLESTQGRSNVELKGKILTAIQHESTANAIKLILLEAVRCIDPTLDIHRIIKGLVCNCAICNRFKFITLAGSCDCDDCMNGVPVPPLMDEAVPVVPVAPAAESTVTCSSDCDECIRPCDVLDNHRDGPVVAVEPCAPAAKCDGCEHGCNICGFTPECECGSHMHNQEVANAAPVPIAAISVAAIPVAEPVAIMAAVPVVIPVAVPVAVPVAIPIAFATGLYAVPFAVPISVPIAVPIMARRVVW